MTLIQLRPLSWYDFLSTNIQRCLFACDNTFKFSILPTPDPARYSITHSYAVGAIIMHSIFDA
jgi:hypothetical protein